MADVEVQAVAAALEQARISAEVSGEYMQAEACRRQLAELEVLDDKRKLEALAAEQLAQRIGMDEAHMVELGQLQAFWNHRLAEIEQKAHLVEDEMLRRFADELSDLRVRARARAPAPAMAARLAVAAHLRQRARPAHAFLAITARRSSAQTRHRSARLATRRSSSCGAKSRRSCARYTTSRRRR